MKKYQTAKNIKFHCYRFKRGHALARFQALGLGSLDVAIARLAKAPTLKLRHTHLALSQ
jgi:hypothetical protein